MEHLVNATRTAIAGRNWYAALALSLALPDICGRIQNPKSSVGDRYTAWWERYVMSKYMDHNPGTNDLVPLLSGADAYALRCAFLHEGSDDITTQKAREVLDRVHFIEPPRGWRVHMNGRGTGTLQVQVDIFCEDICAGANQWRLDHATNPSLGAQFLGLLRIYDVTNRVID